MALQFRALRWKNKKTPLQIRQASLPISQDSAGNISVPDDKVLVKVKAAALNPVDLLLKSMAVPGLFRADKGLGLDYSGDVVAIGLSAAAKTKLRIGDKVCGMNQQPFGDGTVGEYTLVDPFKISGASIRKIPAKLSYEEAAAYPLVGGTAESLFDHCTEGNSYKKVLILGAGTSVGKYCVQLAKQVHGSSHIVVTCSGKSEALSRELGATEVIDYTKNKSILNPVLESVKATGKFDAILDCCGNGDLFSEMPNILRDRKEFGSYITLVGDSKIDYNKSAYRLLISNIPVGIRLIRSKLGFLPYYYRLIKVEGNRDWPDKYTKYFAEKDIKVFIDSVYPFEDFEKAVTKLQSNRATGKLVITI